MKIFLGYASEHLESARTVFDFLKDLGEDVWFDKEALIGGDDWDRERANAQSDANLVIHLISAEIFARPGVVNREIRQTLKLVEDQPIGATYVVFLRLDDLRMPAELLRFQYLDYFKEGWQDQLALVTRKRKAQLGGVPAKVAPERKTVVTEGSAEPINAPIPSRPSRVESTVSTEFYQVSAEHLQYPFGGTYWEFVNARLASEALEGFIGCVADFKRMEDIDKQLIVERNVPHEWGYGMQEFYRKDDFLSIRSSIYWYTGGAHPNHGIRTLNFLGQDHGFCKIEELLGHDEDKAFRLLSYCKKVLSAMFEGEGIEDNFLFQSFDDRQNTWSLASQFNFDDKGITVNFSPYDVLPYAFGSHEVFVPWRFVSPLLDKQFSDLEDRLRA